MFSVWDEKHINKYIYINAYFFFFFWIRPIDSDWEIFPKHFRMNAIRSQKDSKLPVDTTISIVNVPNEYIEVKSPPSRNLSVRILPFPPLRVLGLHKYKRFSGAFPGHRCVVWYQKNRKRLCFRLGYCSFVFCFFPNQSKCICKYVYIKIDGKKTKTSVDA
jgi:hypothetical protein